MGTDLSSLMDFWRRLWPRPGGDGPAELLRENARLGDELRRVALELAAVKDDVAAQRVETAARLAERIEASSLPVSALAGRLRQLEILATEHPGVAAATAPAPPFPSPAVSVITPTWNRAHVLGAAIRSVQAQHFTDWEMIVVDDGSTDDTDAVMAAFSGDRRVRFVKKDHAGQCAARNHALGLVNGALVAYLDSDNIWYPGHLAGAVATFASRPDVDCAYGAMVTEAHGDRRILFEAFDRDALLIANYIGMSTFVHRRALYERYGGFDETLATLEDWDLILRYTAHAPAYRLPFLAVRYRVVDRIRVTFVHGGKLESDVVKIRAKWTA